MANTKSAKKAVRSSGRKRLDNIKIKVRYKKARKDYLDLLAAGKTDEAVKAMANVMKKIDKAAKSKVLHKNTASRYKSRLAAKLKPAVK